MARVPALVLTLALTAAACGGESGQSASSAAESGGFPRTVQGVVIPEEPESIVSTSASHTEILYAIGAGSAVKATDTFSDHPAAAKATEKIDAFNVNVEAVATLEPDLVILAFDPGDVTEGLAALGIPTLLFDAPGNIGDAYAQIETVGAATGHEAEAAELVAAMESDIDQILADLPIPTAPWSYFYELDPTGFSVSSETFVGSLLGMLGMSSIADAAGEPFPQLAAEFVIDANPDFVLLADTKCCGASLVTLGDRPGWDALTAVASGSVIELDDDIASRWGPRLVDLIRTVAGEVYGAP